MQYSVYLEKYFWSVSAPYVFVNIGKLGYQTSMQAVKGCLKNPKCKGVTYLAKKKKFYTATTTKTKLGSGMVFRKRSKGVVSDGYIWRTTGENTKIDGDYLDGTTHANLEAGLTACSKKSACSGVTQLSSDKFRLGKSTGTATKTKATGYFRGSKYYSRGSGLDGTLEEVCI
eukprot:sb/3472150/